MPAPYTLHAMQGLSGVAEASEAAVPRASAQYATALDPRPRHPESTPASHHRLFPHLAWLLNYGGVEPLSLEGDLLADRFRQMKFQGDKVMACESIELLVTGDATENPRAAGTFVWTKVQRPATCCSQKMCASVRVSVLRDTSDEICEPRDLQMALHIPAS